MRPSRQKLRAQPYSASHVAFESTEDLLTPPMAIKPSRALFAYNYNPGLRGGYDRIKGYERFDGQDSPSEQPTNEEHETQRALIQEVPGSGPVRGVHIYDDDVYAIRDDTGATQAVLYKATPAGWQAQANITPAGGRYEFVNANFLGSAGTENMYMCNGVGQAQQWDGTTLTQIATSMADDTPSHIAHHGNYLWLSFEGSLQHSALGNPLDWTVLWGAGEIGTGDTITAIKSMPDGILAIFGEDRIDLLSGRTHSSMVMKEHSRHVGARPYVVKSLGDTYFLDRLGLTTLTATEQSGDMTHSDVSQIIRPNLASRYHLSTASVTVRDEGLMRIFFPSSTGTDFVTMGVQGREVRGFTRGRYNFELFCATEGQIEHRQRQFAGGTDGYVYELDKGPSFDGQPVFAALRQSYNNLKGSTTLKRWRNVWLDVQARTPFDLRFIAEQDYGDDEKQAQPFNIEGIGGQPGYWGIDNWNDFLWSGQETFPARAPLSGHGYNLGMLISSETTYEEPHSILGVTLHYQNRRLLR